LNLIIENTNKNSQILLIYPIFPLTYNSGR
jgi:hypothetical protein